MEILSPAGSFEALKMAVHYGADAVYVGGSAFSARKYAQNFSKEELEQAVDFCHLRGVRLYLCCNTLMKEHELEEAMKWIRHAYAIGVDALIIQDLGLLYKVRRELPDFAVHASTQMTVTNSAGVNALARLRVERVVLAREVSKAQLAEIQRNTQTELEVFVHGALCMSYSGQCLMSSMLGGRSGNRGSCAQPCRLPYELLENGKAVTKKNTLLCPKDLCLADRVSELKELGVASLKIEGRMKSPEYVAMVTHVYKKALCEGVSQDEIDAMLRFFSRGGSCYGYFDGCTYKKMMDDGTKTKISQVLPDLPKREKKMPVSQYLVAKNGEPLTLTMLSKQGESVSVTGAICEQAHTVPTSKERLKEQLEKLGETAFYADYTEVTASPDVAVPIKEINALRRQAAEALSQNITSAYKRNLPPITVAGRQNLPHTNHRVKLCAQVHSLAQLQAAVSRGIERIYLPEKLWSYSHLVQEPVLQMPPLLRECEAGPKVEFSAACVQNIGQLASCWQKDVTAGHRMNITNSQTVELLQNEGVSHFVLSPELNMGAIRAIRQQTKATLEVIAYGRIPLMLLENCVIRNSVGCRCEEAQFALRDRKNEILPILPLHCGNEVYNAKPILMADRLQELTDLGIDSLRLLFTVEDEATTRAIIRLYQEAMAGAEIMAPQFDFTRGHYYRGMQ